MRFFDEYTLDSTTDEQQGRIYQSIVKMFHKLLNLSCPILHASQPSLGF